MSPFSRGRPKGSLFNSYYTEVLGRVLLISLDCFTLPLIRTLYYWVLSKEVSSTIFKRLWYDATGDWTQVSRIIGEHSTHWTNEALFSLETQSPKRHLSIYMMFVPSRSSVEGKGLLEIIRLEVLNSMW